MAERYRRRTRLVLITVIARVTSPFATAAAQETSEAEASLGNIYVGPIPINTQCWNDLPPVPRQPWWIIAHRRCAAAVYETDDRASVSTSDKVLDWWKEGGSKVDLCQWRWDRLWQHLEELRFDAQEVRFAVYASWSTSITDPRMDNVRISETVHVVPKVAAPYLVSGWRPSGHVEEAPRNGKPANTYHRFKDDRDLLDDGLVQVLGTPDSKAVYYLPVRIETREGPAILSQNSILVEQRQDDYFPGFADIEKIFIEPVVKYDLHPSRYYWRPWHLDVSKRPPLPKPPSSGPNSGPTRSMAAPAINHWRSRAPGGVFARLETYSSKREQTTSGCATRQQSLARAIPEPAPHCKRAKTEKSRRDPNPPNTIWGYRPIPAKCQYCWQTKPGRRRL